MLLMILRDKLSGNSSWASYFEGMVETWQPPSTKASGDPGVRLFSVASEPACGRIQIQDPNMDSDTNNLTIKDPSFSNTPMCLLNLHRQAEDSSGHPADGAKVAAWSGAVRNASEALRTPWS